MSKSSDKKETPKPGQNRFVNDPAGLVCEGYGGANGQVYATAEEAEDSYKKAATSKK